MEEKKWRGYPNPMAFILEPARMALKQQELEEAEEETTKQ